MKRYLVERELIQNNIQVLQKKAGSAVIWAVLKGNGYGLGLLPMAETCRAAGLDHFAVTEIAEARALREGGFETEPILMLQPTADADEITALLPSVTSPLPITGIFTAFFTSAMVFKSTGGAYIWGLVLP